MGAVKNDPDDVCAYVLEVILRQQSVRIEDLENELLRVIHLAKEERRPKAAFGNSTGAVNPAAAVRGERAARSRRARG
jgi:hypothetical protein